MKKQFSISVAQPCTEKWENFKPSEEGHFCSSCNKNVIDFTRMNELEIINFFKDNTAKTCGKFLPDQLKNYNQLNAPTIITGAKLFRATTIALILMLITKPVLAKKITTKTVIENVNSLKTEEVDKDTVIAKQSHLVRGIIKDEYGETLPGANILLKGTNIGVIADINGYFEFPKPLQAGDVLLIYFIGFKRLEYKVPQRSEEEVIELVLVMDIEIMGEVAFNEIYSEETVGMKGIWQKVKNWF
ncbi:hypothetical protein GCM10011506_20450 [Marivirga lumbricoides]|uniref:TonB-dependent receptor plug domain-containing protein n=1 Tax=Marivirga lumbricoides TaxID=1046115 RepID=A0ABQ1M600_9BACT|nr:hypothetical protein GCM10011506_20450 [Marivirga lumbricoides]